MLKSDAHRAHLLATCLPTCLLVCFAACSGEVPAGPGDSDASIEADAHLVDGGTEPEDAMADAELPDAALSDGSAPDADSLDPTFSFVVIPDTQDEVLSDRNASRLFDDRIDWIVENQETLDIRFALQTGDLLNWDTETHDQYERASDGFIGLDDANVPYVLAIGNHDTAATCEGGSACPGDTNANLRDTSTFNSYFPETRFPTLSGQFEEDKVDNVYHLFELGGLKWIVISMELWARTSAYQWVDQVLTDHAQYNAIVITHSHLDGNAEIVTSNGGYGDNSPKRIFDDVLSQHANVRMIFSGHTGLSGYREDTGMNGNKIYQFLYNKNNDTNPVRVVNVNTDANTIDSYVYGPATDETLNSPGTTVNVSNVDWVR